MKSNQTLHLMKFAACIIMVAGLSASAFASCGDSLSGMAAAAVVAGQPRVAQAASPRDGIANLSIVGLWHVMFVVGDQTIQEAYQLWNFGGTEIHNPNVDPRSGNVCLGVWKLAPHGVYKLAHRVWSYDSNGNFMGTINLSETITLGHGGSSQSGSFTLDFYDPSGNFQMEVAGNVTGQRISVD